MCPAVLLSADMCAALQVLVTHVGTYRMHCMRCNMQATVLRRRCGCLQVLVTHGGVEMGQGLHIKMAQVAAHELGVPVNKVFIAETSTDKVRGSDMRAEDLTTHGICTSCCCSWFAKSSRGGV